MIEIPVQNHLNSHQIEAQLDGKSYTLRFDWNESCQTWTMAILQEGTPVLHGVMLVPNTPLLQNWRHLPAPDGDFIAHIGDPYAQIERDNFKLYYLMGDDLAAL